MNVRSLLQAGLETEDIKTLIAIRENKPLMAREE
jgi:hypothetical protein